MNRYHRIVLCFGVTLLGLGAGQATPPQGGPAAIPDAVVQPALVSALPSWTKTSSFAGLGNTSDVKLSGINNSQSIGFGVRRDRIVTSAVLHLHYTPSPSLVPELSQLRIYLNNTLTGVLTINKPDLGRPVRQDVPLNRQLLIDFNQLRIEFVGLHSGTCGNSASSTLWLNVARDSSIELREQALATGNDSHGSRHRSSIRGRTNAWFYRSCFPLRRPLVNRRPPRSWPLISAPWRHGAG